MTRIIGAYVLGLTRLSVLVQELHATKGWRATIEVARRNFGGAPVPGHFHRRRTSTVYASNPARMERGRSVRPLLPKQLERAAQRHKWYWNEKARKERADAQV